MIRRLRRLTPQGGRSLTPFAARCSPRHPEHFVLRLPDPSRTEGFSPGSPILNKNKGPHSGAFVYALAEREGFEPSKGF